MSDMRDKPLSEILRNEEIFCLFDEEFQKEKWLDVTVLIHSDCSVNDILQDGSVDKAVMDRIAVKLDELDGKKTTKLDKE